MALGLFGQSQFEGRVIDEVRLVGQKGIDESFLRRQLSSKVGEPYDSAKVVEDSHRLDRLGSFSGIQAGPVEEESKLVLVFTLSMNLKYLPVPSIGVNDENGLAGGVGLKSANFLGRAISLQSAVRFGGATEVEALIQSPWRADRGPWFGQEFRYRDRTNNVLHFQESAVEGDIRGGWQFHPRFRAGALFAYSYLTSDTNGITISPSNSDWIPGIGAISQFDTRDKWTNPRNGWNIITDYTKYGGALGGPADFSTLNIDLRRYQLLTGRHAIANFAFAALQRGNPGTGIPSYRYGFIGGTHSVRGWELAARTGTNQFINSFEYRYEIMRPKTYKIKGFGFFLGVHLAGFADMGSAWTESDQFTKNFIGGGGFGIRIVVPYVNLIRFDFGFGESGKGMTRHFGIREKADYHRLRVR